MDHVLLFIYTAHVHCLLVLTQSSTFEGSLEGCHRFVLHCVSGSEPYQVRKSKVRGADLLMGIAHLTHMYNV